VFLPTWTARANARGASDERYSGADAHALPRVSRRGDGADRLAMSHTAALYVLGPDDRFHRRPRRARRSDVVAVTSPAECAGPSATAGCRRRGLLWHRASGCVLVAFVQFGCAAAKPAVAPRSPVQSALARLAAADAQVRAGCFDCLASALEEYSQLRSLAAVADVASIGAARSAALLAIRERELGTVDGGYLARAREIVAANPRAQATLGALLDIADTLPLRGGVPQVSDDVALMRNQTALQNRDLWTAQLRAHANDDALSAYIWLAFNCAYVPSVDHAVADWLTFEPAWRDTPLVALEAATCGSKTDNRSLERLLMNDPRFVEVHYLLSFGLAYTGRIDAAMDHLLNAYRWRSDWPAVTSALADDYLVLEDFDRAIDFIDRTLALVPRYPDAILNKAKALTYTGRYVDSLQVVDQLLAQKSLVGEARYWRALNEEALGRYDEAWADIELANKELFNAAVPKLAGIIAYRRKQLDVSRENFESSWRRDRDDCETGFYLGIVLGEQGTWTRTADVLIDSVACFEKLETRLYEEIANIRASTQPPDRQTRQINKREAQIASNRRLIVTAWYNTAVSYFTLSKKEEARQFAEKVIADDEFGERARQLLMRLREPAPVHPPRTGPASRGRDRTGSRGGSV
jgi:tetratricopeptide (TPR) repeat protein